MGRRERMVENALRVANDDSHGYSQYRRWPSQGTDFDCSSLMYWAAHEAGYGVPLSGYTGTMLADFTAAGFTAMPWDGNIWDCEPGDILLAHNGSRQHTEMYVGGGNNVGAHIAETGDIDGAPGDQTGNEISVAPNWGPWDYVLTPPADGGNAEPAAPAAEPAPASPKPQEPCYRVFRDGEWRAWRCGGKSAGKKGSPIHDVDFDGLGPNGWFQLTLEDGSVLPRNKHNELHAKRVMGVTVYYDTPDPAGTGYYEAMYRVHPVGCQWLKWEHDDDDGGAGDDLHPIDQLQLKLGKCR